MTSSRRTLYSLILVTIVGLCLSACGSKPTPPKAAPLRAPTSLLRAETPIAPNLNVSIKTFSNADTEGGRIGRIYAPIREAEASYLPIALRDTLIESGYWGAVKVGPSNDVAAELQVNAQIIASNALDLTLQVQVTDSRGIVWINQIYKEPAQTSAYLVDEKVREDPFQSLYNRIANDILGVRQLMPDAEANTIMQAALLRYANALAPQAFAGYLTPDANGIIQVTGLPAVDDTMYARVKKIREAEYRFTDLMDEHFNVFHKRLQTVYPYWQTYSFELIDYNNDISTDRSQRRSGSWAATEYAYRTYKEYKMNEDELRELADSFKAEIHPTISRLEGSVIELTGPLDAQYAQWREILRKLYVQER
jgi:hypothetical protein